MVLCGVDLVETDRIRQALDRFPERFLSMVFTPNEVDYCNARGAGRVASYAARFAAKEAVSKALGTGIGEHAGFQEIEVCTMPGGKPIIQLSGAAESTFKRLGGKHISISLSHTHQYAIANVVIET